MAELIYSVKNLFSVSPESFLKENQYYNIPEYQRGYKWTKENVKTLLVDILKFQKQNIVDGNTDKFYCVQNITLCSHIDREGKQYYNVVDGQQRLTTLLIILSHQDEVDLLKDKFEYSIRTETNQFIKDYILGKKISQYSNWAELEKVLEDNYKRKKDVFYLSEAVFAVKEWYEKNEKEAKKLQKETILNHVKLIVNNLSATNEEKIFSNLNGGKVSLDGADLVRGVLITRVAGEILGDDKIKERINEHRVRIGMELDAINLWWGNKEVAKYFRQLLPEKTTKNKSFDVLSFPINMLYMLYFETIARKDEEFSFKFFEYGINGNERANDDHLEMYQGILKLHYEMQDWFGNRDIYHLLGFLFNYFKNKLDLKAIYEKWEKASSKDKFVEELKKELFIQLFYEKDKNTINVFEELNAKILDIKNDWYNEDNQKLFQVLVLMDIIQIAKNENLRFLPFNFFKPFHEDKEHIRSQTPKKNNEVSKSKEDWRASIVDLNDLSENEVINDILKKSDINELTDDELMKIRGIVNSLGLNSIGNMALLDLSVNRGYGNSAYIDKRREILHNYMEGKYIRLHTLNAFVKNGSKADELNKWELSDIKQNAERIKIELSNYFNSQKSK